MQRKADLDRLFEEANAARKKEVHLSRFLLVSSSDTKGYCFTDENGTDVRLGPDINIPHQYLDAACDWATSESVGEARLGNLDSSDTKAVNAYIFHRMNTRLHSVAWKELPQPPFYFNGVVYSLYVRKPCYLFHTPCYQLTMKVTWCMGQVTWFVASIVETQDIVWEDCEPLNIVFHDSLNC